MTLGLVGDLGDSDDLNLWGATENPSEWNFYFCYFSTKPCDMVGVEFSFL